MSSTGTVPSPQYWPSPVPVPVNSPFLSTSEDPEDIYTATTASQSHNVEAWYPPIHLPYTFPPSDPTMTTTATTTTQHRQQQQQQQQQQQHYHHQQQQQQTSYPSPPPAQQQLTPPSSTPSSTLDSGPWVCKHSACTLPENHLFHRKSDFRRHTDKHTRPYRCPHNSCRDLSGFSWIGGLNRHLDEIHTGKAQHKCPFPNCRRSVEGFSRDANLRSHLVKVHGGRVRVGSSGSGGGGGIGGGGGVTGRKRGREELEKELSEAQREVEKREEEVAKAVEGKVVAMVKLERLRAEAEEARREG